MTSGVQPSDVVRGAAVVVDDKIASPDGALKSILEQLEAAEIPTILRRDLPSRDSLVHWKQFGLIVLDWELSYTGGEGEDIEVGITVPSGLASETRAEITDFVRSLLRETSLPVFIASNANIDEIWSHLDANLTEYVTILRERVRVYSKSELQVSLFETIAEWLASRPALAALRAWNRAYVDAEISTFQHLMDSEEDWVEAVQRSSSLDGLAVGDSLRELLARNVVNRIAPLTLALPPPSEGPMADASSLRQVMHLGAVIPENALADSRLGTGDLFVEIGSQEPHEEIRILLTPDCDLVRQSRPRLTYIPAKRSPAAGKTSKNRVTEVRNGSKGNLATCVLTPSGTEYQITLKDWQSIWVEVQPTEVAEGADLGGNNANQAWPGFRRIGRLLDPHISHIQQHFALQAIRKGLPRIPDDFYEAWKA